MRSATRIPIALLGLLLWPLAALADGPEAGFWWSPSLRFTSVIDDNIYSTKGGNKGDIGFWTAPRVEAGYRGEAFEGPYLESMLDSVPVRPGAPTEYGLGVFTRETPLGALHGHDGVMTGYLATMGYLPEQEIAVCVMLNTDDSRALGQPLGRVAVELATVAVEELEN